MQIKYSRLLDLDKAEDLEEAEQLKEEGWEVARSSPWTIQLYQRIP